jgi:hypothetical protein
MRFSLYTNTLTRCLRRALHHLQETTYESEYRRRSHLRNEAYDLFLASHRDLYADYSFRGSGEYFQSRQNCWHFSRPDRAVLCPKSPALQGNGDQLAEFRQWRCLTLNDNRTRTGLHGCSSTHPLQRCCGYSRVHSSRGLTPLGLRPGRSCAVCSCLSAPLNPRAPRSPLVLLLALIPRVSKVAFKER